LKAGRKSKDLSQQQLAELVQCSVETISNAERGVSLPALELFFPLLDALEIDAATIRLGGAPETSTTTANLRAESINVAKALDDRSLRIWNGVGRLLLDEMAP